MRIESKSFDCGDVEIHRLEGREVISQLFSFELTLVATKAGLGVDALAGAPVSLVFERGETELRRIHGRIVQAADRTQPEQSHFVYEVTVQPSAWLATLVETSDIFMGTVPSDEGGLTAPEVIVHKLTLLDMKEGIDFQLRLRHEYPKRNFVVQYAETDLRFISRIAESWGISFFFEHDEDSDILVFADFPEGHHAATDDGEVPFRGRGEALSVFELKHTRNLVPASYVCSDYNYRTPLVPLEGSHNLEEGLAGGVVEWGTHCKTREEADWFARVRAEERGARCDVFEGRSNVTRFSPGQTVTLVDHPQHSRSLLLTEVHHSATFSTHGHSESVERQYENRFVAIPADRPFRPPRITPVPRIHGVVTGVVEGDKPERHAKLESEGRYRVKLLFDSTQRDARRASKDLRMIQPSAGENYGIHFPLKPGVEVAVAFLHGDPDRPMIVGAVPNPVHRSPVTGSEHTKSRIKSRSGVIIEFDDGNRGPRA